MPDAGAHRGPAIAGDIPGEPDARIPFIEVALDTRLSFEARVPRVAESRRRVRNHRAADAAVERVEAEVVDVGLKEVHRQERVPYDAVVQGNPIEFPGVLKVGAGHRLRHLHRVLAGLTVAADAAGEEVAPSRCR